MKTISVYGERGQPGRPDFFLRKLLLEHGLGDGAAANVSNADDEDVVHG